MIVRYHVHEETPQSIELWFDNQFAIRVSLKELMAIQDHLKDIESEYRSETEGYNGK